MLQRAMIGVLVTGGPGVGKTSLLKELGLRGLTTAGDAAREVIAERKRNGLTPRPPPLEFAEEILRRDCAQYKAASQRGGLVFFDRGVPEALGMLEQARASLPGELEARLAEFVYHEAAFILPPWESIFVQDAERDQTFADTLRVHESLRRWYARCGFRLVEVPRGTVGERAEFVLREVAAVMPNPSIEATPSGKLRLPTAAPHAER
jgi:predicted ATPase